VLCITTVAGHHRREADMGASSLHRRETLSLGTLLPPLETLTLDL